MDTADISFLLAQLRELKDDDPKFAITSVDLVLEIAQRLNASDIHWHPRLDCWDVSLRVDGVMQPLVKLPRSHQTDPVMRMKVLAHLLTYQTILPQEGRLDLSNSELEARLSTFPTVHGERAVVRLLPQRKFFTELNQLGFEEETIRELRELIQARDGAVLITGSAGSGKTTTLYTILHELIAAENHRTILTVEDPVEAIIDGISQSALNPAAGLDFATALRSVLRQDPEVLVIGEVRDPESAESALRVALTGHLVLTTLHASDAATALRRLQELGLPHYLIRSGLRGILCQRLVRRLCNHCREPAPEEARLHGLQNAWRAPGVRIVYTLVTAVELRSPNSCVLIEGVSLMLSPVVSKSV